MAIEVEKTHYFTLDDGTTLPVARLPEQVKEQVKIFDEIRANYVNKTFEANVYQLALEKKQEQLQKVLKNLVNAQKHADQQNNASEGPTEVTETPT